MNQYFYSKNILLTKEKLLKEMDLSIFFDANIANEKSTAFPKLLETLGIYSDNLDYEKSQITIRMFLPQKSQEVSHISHGYYDQNHKLFSQFTILLGTGTLLSLEGEIYEYLNLDLEDVETFLKQHQYEQHIYPETRSCIHFKGVEYNRFERLQYEQMLQNMKERQLNEKEQKILLSMHEKTKETKEIYITKDAQKFQFYYNGPHIFNNRSSSSHLSKEEIGIIQNRIEQLLFLNGNHNMKINFTCPQESRNDNEQFLEYIYVYLGQYRRMLETKRINEFGISSDSLQKLKNCIQNPDSDGICCEINIISSIPFTTTEEKNHQFLKTMN